MVAALALQVISSQSRIESEKLEGREGLLPRTC